MSNVHPSYRIFEPAVPDVEPQQIELDPVVLESDMYELLQTLKKVAMASGEPVNIDIAKNELIDIIGLCDELVLDEICPERLLQAVVWRANCYAMGEFIANLYETPDSELPLEEGESADEYRRELIFLKGDATVLRGVQSDPVR